MLVTFNSSSFFQKNMFPQFFVCGELDKEHRTCTMHSYNLNDVILLKCNRGADGERPFFKDYLMTVWSNEKLCLILLSKCVKVIPLNPKHIINDSSETGVMNLTVRNVKEAGDYRVLSTLFITSNFCCSMHIVSHLWVT